MNNDFHWRWWHWVLLIAVIVFVLGLGYSWINNYKIVKRDDLGAIDSTKQVIEHPIQSTENAIRDITNN